MRVFDQLVDRIDPTTGVVAASVPVGPLPWVPVAAFGAIWVPSIDGTVTRVDIATNEASTVELSTEETSLQLTEADGAVWAVDGVSGKIWRIEPDGAVAASSIRPTPPSSFFDINLAVGNGHLFMRSGDEAVWEIDPQTDEMVATHTATGAGGHVAIGYGSLWVAGFDDQVVWRIPLD